MKESYSEVLARYAGPESYAGDGNVTGVATAGVHLGPEFESRNVHRPEPDLLVHGEGNTRSTVLARATEGSAGSMNRSMGGNSKHENRETPRARRRKSPTAVRKPLRGYHGHERDRGVRWIHSTDESGEQRWN